MSDLRLNDLPDWRYLLREFYEFYRYLSSGGSEKIRAHQRTAREAISRVMTDNPPLRFRTPESKPVVAHFRRALDEGLMERHAPVMRAIDAVSSAFDWQYGYEKVPRGLGSKYAYAEIAGPSGPVLTERVILGLVLFAPKCTYPAHAHDGITESYICLSGAVSENHQGVFGPGSLIFNPPGTHHRITVSDKEPSLLAYAWTGPAEKLANQKMVFSRPRRATRSA
ncbi:MAG: dimethylsulfonioproprionate lyase family protein [Pseudomonadota bacterium]